MCICESVGGECLLVACVAVREIFSQGERPKQKNATDEMDISENGPSELRTKKLLVVTLDKYWKEAKKFQQKFLTKRQNTQSWINSIVNIMAAVSWFKYGFSC